MTRNVIGIKYRIFAIGFTLDLVLLMLKFNCYFPSLIHQNCKMLKREQNLLYSDRCLVQLQFAHHNSSSIISYVRANPDMAVLPLSASQQAMLQELVQKI